MNMWGLPPRFLEMLEDGFAGFLDSLGDDAMKAEYLLPKIIDKLLAEQKARVKVLETGTAGLASPIKRTSRLWWIPFRR
ncbi:MAG: hypothetical protein ACLUD2_08165 [Clostridium sp.]